VCVPLLATSPSHPESLPAVFTPAVHTYAPLPSAAHSYAPLPVVPQPQVATAPLLQDPYAPLPKVQRAAPPSTNQPQNYALQSLGRHGPRPATPFPFQAEISNIAVVEASATTQQYAPLPLAIKGPPPNSQQYSKISQVAAVETTATQTPSISRPTSSAPSLSEACYFRRQNAKGSQQEKRPGAHQNVFEPTSLTRASPSKYTRASGPHSAFPSGTRL
jgi:hypothetical protein